MIDLEMAKNAFDDYVNQYNLRDKNIQLKKEHTYRVCMQSINIAKSLELNEEDTKLAILIALLHDIGRFEQIRIYNTFEDSKSIDHALLGVRILFDEGLIREFIKEDKYDEIIKKAIYYHNKYEIEECNDKELLHSKIIRDIDKIDIINIAVNLNGIKIKSDESPISKKVDESFKNNKPIRHKDKLTKNDSMLMMLAFIFDLNFDYSLQYFLDNNYIDLFYSKIENKDIFAKYINIAKEYIERKCSNVRNKVFSQKSRRREI